MACLLLCKGAVQQPGHDGEVLPLIVRRQNDRELVLGALCGGHCVSCCAGKKRVIGDKRVC